jgi:poly(A) polymerase
MVRINQDNCFKNDPIRIIRIFRLAALNRFDIDPKTLRIAQKDSYLLKKTSKERITDEIKKFLSLNNTFAYLLLMDKADVIDSIFERLTLTNGCIQSEHHLFDVKTHSLSVYNFIEWSFNRLDKILGRCYSKYLVHFTSKKGTVLISLKLAALFHDSGKPFSKIVTKDGRVKFPEHEKKSAEVFLQCSKDYSFGKQIVKLTKFFIEKHIEPSYIFALWDKQQLSFDEIIDFFLRYGEHGIDLLFFALADTLAKGKISAVKREVYVDFLRFMANTYYSKIKHRMYEKPLINGDDILGHFEKVDVKELQFLLNELKKSQIAGRIKTKGEALEFVASLTE